jgi:hypothetical protein
MHDRVIKVEDIAEQRQALNQVEGIREIRQTGKTVILTLGSGCYHFSCTLPTQAMRSSAASS